MATHAGKFIDDYYGFWESVGDPRVKHWFLMRSPELALIILVAYLLFVQKIGPKWMENRKPYDIKNVMLLYNIIQVITCSYIFYTGSITAWLNKYKWFCEPIDYSVNPEALTMAAMCYYYYLTKMLDLFDTIFFVLRKKNNYVTVLHLVHHTYMAAATWLAVKIRPGGSYSFFGYINCFVHIIMYWYYLLAAMGPQVKKYLWWKKYLTTLQMGQFVLVLLHLIPHFFIKDCDMPKGFIGLIVVGAITFFILFANFYRMEYIVKPKKVDQLRNRIKSKSS